MRTDDARYMEVMHNAWRHSMGMPTIPPYLLRNAMTKEKLPGGKLGANFYGGTRSEYLAHYGLSRFALTNQGPRQADFGVVGFKCVLARIKVKVLYPENAFYVQTKATREDFNLSKDTIIWIRQHLDLPLYVCVADKSDDSLSFYSLSPLYVLLFQISKEITGITITMNKDEPRYHELVDGEKRNHSDIQYLVHLGVPFFTTSLDKLENATEAKDAYSVLKKWIQTEDRNIINKKMGGLYSNHVSTSDREKAINDTFQIYYHGKNYKIAELHISMQIAALVINYRSRTRSNELSIDDKKVLEDKIKLLSDYLKIDNRNAIIDYFTKKMD